MGGKQFPTPVPVLADIARNSKFFDPVIGTILDIEKLLETNVDETFGRLLSPRM
jgi:hypothetical protein